LIEAGAAAKVNLALHVTGRRDDGYHLLETLVVFCEAGDVLTVEPAARDAFSLDGPFAAALDSGAGNLVLGARDALRSASAAKGIAAPPVAIRLDKQLPVAAGIGGGSADAAATLRALCRVWGVPEAALPALAARLGADVPMCLSRAPQLATGIGEELRPLIDFPPLDIVLLNPGVPVSTAAVFAALECRENSPLPRLPDRIDFKGLVSFLRMTRNDLERPALAAAPPIGTALDALRGAGAAFARMSGSGATCFGLFESGEAARGAAARLRTSFPGCYVVATRTFASETP